MLALVQPFTLIHHLQDVHSKDIRTKCHISPCQSISVRPTGIC